MAKKISDPFENCTAGGCTLDTNRAEVNHTSLCEAYNSHLGAMTDAFLSQMGDDTLFLDTYGLVERFEAAVPKRNGDMNRPYIRAAASLLLACKELEAFYESEGKRPKSVFLKGQEMPFFHEMRMRIESIRYEDL